MTLSRLPDSLQRGSRSFDTLNAKGTWDKFYLKLVFGLYPYCFRVGFRIWGEFISESFLRDIMYSLTDDSIGRILEFTTELDERKMKRAYGFFVELDGEIGIFMFTPKSSHG